MFTLSFLLILCRLNYLARARKIDETAIDTSARERNRSRALVLSSRPRFQVFRDAIVVRDLDSLLPRSLPPPPPRGEFYGYCCAPERQFR